MFGNTKNYRYWCCLAKMMFNKSHLCMCTIYYKGHFITIKIFPGEKGAAGGAEAHGGSCPLSGTTGGNDYLRHLFNIHFSK